MEAGRHWTICGWGYKWGILAFLSWIRRTLCWESSAQKDHQFVEKANFSQQTSVGAELQNQLFFDLSHNPLLSEGLSLPDPLPSFLNIGFSQYSPESLCVGSFLYPLMVQESFPSEISISNKKEESTMFEGLNLSRIKWTQKYAIYDGIKVTRLNIHFCELAQESCMSAMLL